MLVSLLLALRNEILQVFRVRSVNALSDGARDKVFDYLTSADFTRRVSGVVDSYNDMRKSLDTQKKQFSKRMLEQEHALDKMLTGISGVYGDLSLRVGSALKPVQGLEVDDVDDSQALLHVAENDSSSDTSAA